VLRELESEARTMFERVLRKCTRAIVHMRQQLRNERFGLVLGAGVGKDLRFPNWEELVDRIAHDSRVNGVEVIRNQKSRSPQASLTQMLFEHFKSSYLEQNQGPTNCSLELEREYIYKHWREIVHENLYRETVEGIDGTHPYLEEYLDVIARSSMTVNYNFDDTIERMLAARRQTEQQYRTRGYETVWDPRMQFRSTKGVIYHPNGFLPRNLLEGPSDRLVLAEDSFADQLIDSMAGHYATLLHHLLKNTCLFIGLSLEDSTLKHLLRQNSRINPGNLHYYIAYTPDSSSLGPAERRAIVASNFDTYNLITMFLNSDEIRVLGILLNMDSLDLRHFADEVGVDLTFFYYFTGVPGAGKTTSVSYFRSLATYAEWPDSRPAELAKPFTELSDEERDMVDAWIVREFAIKNLNLIDQSEGIHVIDRCPLDPISFTPDEDWPRKASRLLQAISPGRSNRIVQSGYIILLHGDVKVLSIRLASRHKEGSPEYLTLLYERLSTIYEGEGLTKLDIRGMSIPEMIKRIARIIHMDEYTEADIHGRLLAIKRGKLRYTEPLGAVMNRYN